ncbi:hypothetical protein GALL_477730 [mine drainage metagenome]|uniref:Uncharacterized protein n=1 Tax=mine drainage metagenome TaxID=410659 RepID=A0A1J5PGQ9_9ZZZZ
MLHTLRADFARIDFDGKLAAGLQVEEFAGHCHQAPGFIIAQKGGRAATPVQLRDGQARAEKA